MTDVKLPSWYDLSKFGWISFKKHPNENGKYDLPSIRRVTLAAKRVYNSLDASDQRIIMGRSELPNDERKARFRFLCWVLACESGLTSKYQSLSPPEHFHPPMTEPDQIFTDSISEEEYNEQAE